MIPSKGKNIKNITSIEDKALLKVEGRNGKEVVIKWSEIKTLLNSELTIPTTDEVDLAGYTYTEVAISNAEFATMGTSPIQLLAAPGANKYYDFDNIIVEYNYAGASSNLLDYVAVYGSSNYYFLAAANLVSSAESRYAMMDDWYSNYDNVEEITYTQGFSIENVPVVLGTWANNNPTAGAGSSLLVKIWHKVKTFGTEL